MNTATPTYTDLDAANARIAALEAELASCRAQGRRMEARIKKLLDERSFERRVRRGKNISPINKEVGLLLTQHYAAQDEPEPEADGSPGLKSVYLPSAAEALGVSPDTVGRALRSLRDAGAFRYETRTTRGADGAPVNRSFYAPLPAWREHPEQVAEAAPPRKHGGARVVCPNRECESERVILRSHYVCMDCGTQWGHAERPANAPDDTDPATEDEAAPRNISPAPQLAARGGTSPVEPPPLAPAGDDPGDDPGGDPPVELFPPSVPAPVYSCRMCASEGIDSEWRWYGDAYGWCCTECDRPAPDTRQGGAA